MDAEVVLEDKHIRARETHPPKFQVIDPKSTVQTVYGMVTVGR